MNTKRSLAALLLALALGAGSPAQTPDLYDPSVVRSLHLTFKQSNWWQLLEGNRSSKTDIPGDLTVDSKVYKDIGVRFKSHASYNGAGASKKKPFNLSMDSFVSGQRLYGIKTLNLQNGFLDPTFVREIITLQMMRRYLPAPRAVFVKLYINTQYWGLYTSVEQVNQDLPGRWFPNIDGNHYKADPTDSKTPAGNSALVWLGASVNTYKKSYDLKTGSRQTPWMDLVNLIDKLNNTAPSLLEQVLPQVLDVDRALWFTALNNVFCNLDSYIGSGHNYYLYHEVLGDRFHTIPWDLNRSFGTFDMGLSLTSLQTLSPYHGETSTISHPLVNRLFSKTVWKEHYRAHVRTVLKESFNRNTLDALIKKYQDLIRSDVQADPNKLYDMSLFDLGVSQDLKIAVPGSSVLQLLPGLKPFISARSGHLNAHPDITETTPVITGLSHSPARPPAGETVWINAKVTASTSISEVVAAHATAGTFVTVKMHDDGNHHDGLKGDGVYGGAVAPVGFGTTVKYYVRARTSTGGTSFAPARAELVTASYTATAGRIRISEFLAKNDTGIRDEKGEYEDWIEILNTGPAAVDLGGNYLTDDPKVPTRWVIPSKTLLQPGQALLVWADNEPGEGPLHATFKLSAGGESVALFAGDGKTLLDLFTFGPQLGDVSTGRMAGQDGIWVTFPDPTPRSPNLPVSCGHLRYDALDPASTPLSLSASGTPGIGKQVVYSVAGAPPSTPGLLGISTAPIHVGLGSPGTLLIHPFNIALLPLATGTNGTANFPLAIPGEQVLRGVVFYLQGYVHDGMQGGLTGGVLSRICP